MPLRKTRMIGEALEVGSWKTDNQAGDGAQGLWCWGDQLANEWVT